MISVLMTAALVGLGVSGASSFKQGLLAMFFLVVLLIFKELAGAAADFSRSFKTKTFARAVRGVLTIPVVPLLFVLGFIVIANLSRMLQ